MGVIDQRLIAADNGVGGDAKRQRTIVDPIRAGCKAVACHAAIIEGEDAGGGFQHAQMLGQGHGASCPRRGPRVKRVCAMAPRLLTSFTFDLNQPLIKPLRAFCADPKKESPHGLDDGLLAVIQVLRKPLRPWFLRAFHPQSVPMFSECA